MERMFGKSSLLLREVLVYAEQLYFAALLNVDDLSEIGCDDFAPSVDRLRDMMYTKGGQV